MRYAVLILVALCSVLPCAAADRYEVKYFDCYMVGLLTVIDSTNGKIVSRPYGAGPGVSPHLDRVVKKWNIQGIRPEDERNLETTLRRNGMFAFPETIEKVEN